MRRVMVICVGRMKERFYAGAAAPFAVHVVKTYRGRCHERAPRSFEQRGVAAGACARHQRVGISHRRAVNLTGSQLCNRYSGSPERGRYEGNITFHHYFQIHRFHIYSTAHTPASESTQM